MTARMSWDELAETLETLDDWEERYRTIIELGQALPPFPEAWQNERYRIQGCMSQVWMKLDVEDGRLRIQAVSDALIVKGLIAILITLFDGMPLERVAATDVEALFQRFKFDQHLSPGRRNGFFSMVAAIKSAA